MERNSFAGDPVVLNIRFDTAISFDFTQPLTSSMSGQGDSEVSGNNAFVLQGSLDTVTSEISDATFHSLPEKHTNLILLLGMCREVFLNFLPFFFFVTRTTLLCIVVFKNK